MTNKPPIGLMPKFIYQHNNNVNRFNAILKAIIGYHEAGIKIPIEWVEEYNELIDLLKLK